MLARAQPGTGGPQCPGAAHASRGEMGNAARGSSGPLCSSVRPHLLNSECRPWPAGGSVFWGASLRSPFPPAHTIKAQSTWATGPFLKMCTLYNVSLYFNIASWETLHTLCEG